MGAIVSENGIGRNITARGAPTFHGSMQLPRIVGDHGIRQQCERAGNEDFLLAPPATIGADRSGMDDPFQLVHRFSADQDPT
jgi:hypothetical protein